ncbi:ABC transporter related protein [Magnetococcus marinus MC-1]|uniref:Zinc import ATP-binding protein ZnuC n=1 Tax=Magnetococcus marinus (strain ATCC BAA-1437 / JCM 17883 / MC-1) TaxID=156889 RepID=ZNUC_MAGMM|nr:metal ABC transporter ATP-binding protein [Magnetococcus marinus]A0LCH8.1 RecName: Full=Zinc import ATP-binding protein ZnuC [Magnetococcus marinus MC-1]ABK45671.1 ABC transporter related protein [Magnetococcus marinus MC-1]
MSDTSLTHCSEVLLTARNLCADRGGRRVLEGIDLSIGAGEVVTIIGPNGAGKSTLLKVLLGVEPYSEGQVIRKANLCVGYVPQRMPVDAILPMTVQRMLRLAKEVDETAMLAVLEETGVAHVLHAPLQGLSGGEFQRVLLARAMLRNPQLLVLDEPVQGVDYSGEVALYQLIGALRKRHGCGVLLVSHDLHMVMRDTDRVVCLNRHICCTGTPDHVSGHPEFARLFGDQALQTLALYQHHHHSCTHHMPVDVAIDPQEQA